MFGLEEVLQNRRSEVQEHVVVRNSETPDLLVSPGQISALLVFGSEEVLQNRRSEVQEHVLSAIQKLLIF